MRKRIGNKKIRKSGNGNVFQNLLKIGVNIFEKLKKIQKFNAADP